MAAEKLAMEQRAAELAETLRELTEANAALQLARSAGRAAGGKAGGPVDVGEGAGAEARAAGGDQSRPDREW